MLCTLAHFFPDHVARFLERDRGLTRNFREETVTDLLMASLVALGPVGVRVDYPDERKTGADMDWIFAAPREINGGRYLRILLQAKRASASRAKRSSPWRYQHLDHGRPKGQQAHTLLDYASKRPGGMATLPMYILYHPKSALASAAGKLPAIEGVNLVFAAQVAPIVWGGCTSAQKAVSFWRPRFLQLSDFLCWAIPGIPAGPNIFHPDLVAMRLRSRAEGISSDARKLDHAVPVIEVSDKIPVAVQRAIDGQMNDEDYEKLEWPRVIFTTNLKQGDPEYKRIKAKLKP